MHLTIALVQMAIQQSDPQTNFQNMASWMAKARKKGADLVVFPEDAITGPLEGQTAFADRAGEFYERCQRLAMEHGVDLVPGSWSVPDAGGLYNTTYYINADGSLAGFYSKSNLWATEEATITPGPGPVVVPTRHGLVGLMICWDIAHPAMFQAMAGMGAELVVSPTYWSLSRRAEASRSIKKDELDLIDSLCVARAFEADVVLAYCNAAGLVGDEKKDGMLSGRTQLTHPHEKTLCRAKGNGEQLLVQTFTHARAAAGSIG